MDTKPSKPIELYLIAIAIIVIGCIRGAGLLAALVIPEVRDTLESLDVQNLEGALWSPPVEVHYLVSIVGVVVFLLGGAGLLAAKNWARILVVVWAGWSLVFTFLVTGSAGYLLPKMVAYLITIGLLFNPRVSRTLRGS